MATENEFKYLLPVDFNNSALTDWEKSVIMQGYLNDATAFIRRNEDGKPVFVVSMETVHGSEITFETLNISENEFEKLSRHAKFCKDDMYILPNATRIRNKSGIYGITYKQWVDSDLIEIEDDTSVTKDIFDAFQPYAADFIFKDRYEKQINDEEWVVDYLRDYGTQKVYYTHSEVEVPYGRTQPLYMPDCIATACLFAPDQDDVRFTNQLLSNQEHAKSLYRKYAPQ